MSESKDAPNQSSTNKRALLARLLEEKAQQATRAPLSFAQQRLWILDQLDNGSAAYNISRAVRLEGDLDLQALRKALNEVVARHKSLRTNFVVVDSEPVQQVSPSLTIEPQLHDLRSLAANLRESEALRLAAQLAGDDFDLQRDSLLRVHLFQLDDRDTVMLLVMHHIVSDGWSLAVLFHELTTLYEAFAKSQPSPLPPLSIQYTDFARWQHEPEQEAKRQTDLRFWKAELAGAPPLLELPGDRPRPAVQSFAGRHDTFFIDSKLTEALNQLSRKENVTLFMTLLAAFQTLLYRYTYQQDIVVGTPIANRTQTEMEGLIGFFVNTLVMRTDFSGRPHFRELLSRVKQIALNAFAHQNLPFERLLEEVQLDRSLAYTPVVQILFALQNMPRPILKLGELEVSEFLFPKRTSKLDLSLYVGATTDGLTLSFEYSTDLFDVSTIERMAGHYRMLLEGAVAQPECPVAELPLLTVAEQQSIRQQVSNVESETQPEPVHRAFERQVQQGGDSLAVTCGELSWTYDELNRKANRIACYLSGRLVGPDRLVAVFLDRSANMIAALLGIMKAGCAYVPLDPLYPSERLAYILNDANIDLLLTEHALLTAVPQTDVETVLIDDEILLNKQSDANPALAVKMNQLAYLIYTSGSTGKPKGTEIPHSALVNLLRSMQKRPGLIAADTLLSVTTLSFDIAALELFLPLVTGARLLLASREAALDPSELASLIERYQVTVMQATPSTWRMLVESPWQGRPGLKILCGGEALPRDLANELCQRADSVWNMYGPTETTIWSALHLVTRGDDAIVIGRPIDNTRMYILDKTLQPVPVGIPGELFIAGAGLARGYWQRPELTAERFVPEPATINGLRMYRTGDLARFHADGTIEVLTRIDNQVKIRGHRIELAEIEATLEQHERVRQAVVSARGDSGEQRLVGYLVAEGDELSVSELRAWLRTKLPDYMVPGEYMYLDRLPLTPNGKIDRKALPEPDKSRQAIEVQFIAPRNELEKILAEIWTNVLKREVGVQDNFFDLGGHSLMATQLLSKISRRMK